MKRALALIVGVAMVCIVAYLSWLNPTAVTFHFAPTRSIEAPLAALIVFAFVVGALAVLTVVLIQAGRRAVVSVARRAGGNGGPSASTPGRSMASSWCGRAMCSKAARCCTRHGGGGPKTPARCSHWRRRCVKPARYSARAWLSKRRHGTTTRIPTSCSPWPRRSGPPATTSPPSKHSNGLRALHPRAPRVLRRCCATRYVEAQRWRKLPRSRKPSSASYAIPTISSGNAGN